MLEDELDAAVDAAIRSLSILEYEYENEAEQLLACAPEETTVLVAADTGAVDHVIPSEPCLEDAYRTASSNATSSTRTTRTSKPTADVTL